jgi:hypothetical protein
VETVFTPGLSNTAGNLAPDSLLSALATGGHVQTHGV